MMTNGEVKRLILSKFRFENGMWFSVRGNKRTNNPEVAKACRINHTTVVGIRNQLVAETGCEDLYRSSPKN